MAKIFNSRFFEITPDPGMDIMDKPIQFYINQERDGDAVCTYCGTPALQGEQIAFDPVLDSVYCTKKCRDQHLVFEPGLLKLYEQEE